MKETLELRVDYDYAHLLFKADEGKDLGGLVPFIKAVVISKEDPRYSQIPIINEEVKKKYGWSFFYGWDIKRKYTKKELDAATLLHMGINELFEPTGEQCGTVYDETIACKICGANRKQIGSLILKKGTIPKKDIAQTIGGEVVVSEKFVNIARQRNLRGLQFSPVNVKEYYQLDANIEIDLSPNTIVGVNPFDLSTSCEGEIYKCPNGDTIGLAILSEPYVLSNQSIGKYDFFSSKQKIGVNRGVLRPESLYFCSQAFRKMIKEEKLTGFWFEVANIE